MLRVKSLHDEVERTRLELEVKNRDLLRLEEFKEKLMQMVVHDLKNPLAGIMGNLQLLQIQGTRQDATHLREILARTEESAKQLMGLILNILDVARMEEGKVVLRRQRVSASLLAETCLRQVEGLAARSEVELALAIQGVPPELSADPEILSRVLANLVNNALKHTPPGGKVEVGASAEGEGVRFWVRDSGEGISGDLLPRIFDKFVSGSGHRGEGRSTYDTGLGLTFCKMAVEAHGGTIGVESEPGRGSTFSCALPPAPAGEGATTLRTDGGAGNG
jgi:signal transduction histidine kinase